MDGWQVLVIFFRDCSWQGSVSSFERNSVEACMIVGLLMIVEVRLERSIIKVVTKFLDLRQIERECVELQSRR